jgi:hypothetical protein
MQHIWAPGSIQDCRAPVIRTGFPLFFRHCSFIHYLYFLSFISVFFSFRNLFYLSPQTTSSAILFIQI